jgi:hypothetical protein
MKMCKIALLILVSSLVAHAQAAPSGAPGCPIQVVDFKPVFVPQLWVKNLAGKAIREVKFLVAYPDTAENYHWLPAVLDWQQPVKPGETRMYDWPRQIHRDEFHVGTVVVPSKVLFEDGSVWRPDASPAGDLFSVDASCAGQFWRDKNHPATTTVQAPASLWK